jgi:hypothetical protein
MKQIPLSGPVVAIAALILFVLASAIATGLGAPVPEADRQLIVGLLVGAAGGYGGRVLQTRRGHFDDGEPVIGEEP